MGGPTGVFSTLQTNLCAPCSEASLVVAVLVPCLVGTARSLRTKAQMFCLKLGFWWQGKTSQDSGSVSEMTQSLPRFLVMTVSAPVFSCLTADPVLSRQLRDWTVNIRADRADIPSPDPGPPEGESSQVGKSKLGTPTACNSQRLDIVRASRWVSLFLSLSCYIPSKGQLWVTQARSWRRLPFSMCCYHLLGVGREHIQQNPGSLSFHKEHRGLTPPMRTLPRPNHVTHHTCPRGGWGNALWLYVCGTQPRTCFLRVSMTSASCSA